MEKKNYLACKELKDYNQSHFTLLAPLHEEELSGGVIIIERGP